LEISNQFNKFYHSRILTDLFRKAPYLIFKELKDTRTGTAFKMVKYEDYNDLDDLKQLLKILNFNYGVDMEKDCKVSTRDIEVKELLSHIEWVLRLALFNGIELDLVREEWDRLIQTYNR